MERMSICMNMVFKIIGRSGLLKVVQRAYIVSIWKIFPNLSANRIIQQSINPAPSIIAEMLLLNLLHAPCSCIAQLLPALPNTSALML